ncbi:MAG TPA: hypothetical protein VHU18_12235 [Rhizomicrobium sp.]|jgi:hypothetical protein|nr:hypothetical protein [Rhizomicrobium sp.]
MKRLLVSISAASILTAGSISAQAAGQLRHYQAHSISPLGLLSLRSHATPSVGKDIVGTWLATYDGGTRNVFAQWHKDGTTVQNADFPSIEGNIILGDWKKISGHTVSVSLIAWNYDDSGNLTGWLTKTETDQLSGDSYSGNFEVTFYDLSGNIIFQHDGTLTATRVD